MPTVEDALLYIGIDYADEMVTANATRALAAARRTLLGAVGEDVETVLEGDERITELILIYFDDLYSERGISAKTNLKVSSATRNLVNSMEIQLKMELERKRGAAS